MLGVTPDLRVADDIRIAETLPPSAVLDRDILARELDTIFRRAWLLVPEPSERGGDDAGRSLLDQVGARGQRVPFTLT